MDSPLVDSMKRCDGNGPVVANVCKLYPKADCSGFDAFARVLSGTLKVQLEPPAQPFVSVSPG